VGGEALPACVPALVSFALGATPPVLSIHPQDSRQIFVQTSDWTDLIPRDLDIALVTFSSSNTSIATVNEVSGLVKPVSLGSTWIVGTVVGSDGKTITARINITVMPILALKTIPRQPLLLVGSAFNMRIEYQLADGTLVPTTRCGIWSSSNSSAVNITTTGFLQAIAKTVATLSVSVADYGVSTTTSVTVMEIFNSFMDSTDPTAVLGGHAVFTGTGTALSGITDPLGQGWLRLTDNGVTRLGYV
jgi:hypothetical protein